MFKIFFHFCCFLLFQLVAAFIENSTVHHRQQQKEKVQHFQETVKHRATTKERQIKQQERERIQQLVRLQEKMQL